MKILHWALIFLAIIIPVSIVCRITVNSKFSALKDEVRINNAIDNATKDAIDQIITVSGFDYDDEFGDVIDITPELAQECINVFFHSMAVNYNIPYRMSDSTTIAADNASESYIKNYFATYIPAIVVIAYDGFYVYSQERTSVGFQYQLSSKIPYTYTPVGANFTIGYTLGNDIYLIVRDDVKHECYSYSGRLNYNSLEEINAAYEDYKDPFTGNYYDLDTLISITNDMSVIIKSLTEKNSLKGDTSAIIPSSTTDNFLQDYVRDTAGNYKVGAFHEKRREVIMKIISDCLNEEMNEQNTFADLVGCSYEFHLPTISNDDWINSINDISIMSFIQGIPVGNTEGLYYNSYALGGSQIVRRDLIYGAKYTSGVNLYHTPDCPVLLGDDGVLTDDDYDLIFITEDDAYANGYISCQKCH